MTGAARVGPAAGAAKPIGAGPALPGPGETMGGLRGARTELRNRMRSRRRLRVVTLMSLAVVVLVVLPAFFGLRVGRQGPGVRLARRAGRAVLGGERGRGPDQRQPVVLPRLPVPGADAPARSGRSRRPPRPTRTALTDGRLAAVEGRRVPGAADRPGGRHLQLLAARRVHSGPAGAACPTARWTAGRAGPGRAAVDRRGAATTDPKKCVGSTVSIKVQNAITDTRGKPEPKQSPDLVGETPDPTLSDDPLLTPTPAAS